jgi:hypothetical protein
MTNGNIIRAVFGVVCPPAIMLIFTTIGGSYFDRFVNPAGGVTVDAWTQRFTDEGLIAASIIFLLSLTWHLVALLTSGRRGDKRWLWWLICIASAILPIIVLRIWLLPADGRALAVILGGLTGIFSFWFVTLWTSPSTHKYAPVGRLWIGNAF